MKFVFDNNKFVRSSNMYHVPDLDTMRNVEEFNMDKYQHGDIICTHANGYRNEGKYIIMNHNGKKHLMGLTEAFDEYGSIFPAFDCYETRYNFHTIDHNDIRWIKLSSLLKNYKNYKITEPVLSHLKDLEKKGLGSWFYYYEPGFDYNTKAHSNKLFIVEYDENNYYKIVYTEDGIDIKDYQTTGNNGTLLEFVFLDELEKIKEKEMDILYDALVEKLLSKTKIKTIVIKDKKNYMTIEINCGECIKITDLDKRNAVLNLLNGKICGNKFLRVLKFFYSKDYTNNSSGILSMVFPENIETLIIKKLK